ncbi:MAG TPA: hypothetical protein VGH10_02615 [Actinomycetota bacterium]|jgi:hypothetical protein
MVIQAAIFLILIIGIPILVAWLLGGDKQAKQDKARAKADAKAAAKAASQSQE